MEIKKTTGILTFLTILITLTSVKDKEKNEKPDKPKLVIGIVVDQMRYDYISRYWDKYSNDGFKKLIAKGYFCKNTTYNYVPTFTAPGHASIYTGTTPAYHGIIANYWYNKYENKSVYCTSDSTYATVGSSSEAGKMSPHSMLTTTVTDELRLATNLKSKVIGISLKDRGAILPAGHTANAAYWFDGSSGNWISSTYYMEKLPLWLEKFNNRKLAENYITQNWSTLMNINEYTESHQDNSPYEGLIANEKEPVFTHITHHDEAITSYEIVKATPWGNTLTKELAIAALQAEQLGKGDYTDFLCVSFSSTDYIGHKYGINAVETEDAYLRLDKDIAELLAFLESHLGKDDYLLFLTADHAGVHVPAYLQDLKIPAGYFETQKNLTTLKAYLKSIYGEGEWIKSYSNEQIFLNHDLIEKQKIDLYEMEQKIVRNVITFNGVADAYTAEDIHRGSFEAGSIPYYIKKGFSYKYSGDVILTLEPSWIEYAKTGTTHGSAYMYDRHVPLIWYGWKVKNGESFKPVSITDIAPTLSSYLNISFPNGCVGQPLKGIISDK